MSSTPRGWLFDGDARQEVDRAIAECTQDHSGDVQLGPAVFKRMIVCDDGTELERTVALVLDEEGWWYNYARFHGWRELTPLQMLDLFREIRRERSEA